jgi:hypothetical protein
VGHRREVVPGGQLHLLLAQRRRQRLEQPEIEVIGTGVERVHADLGARAQQVTHLADEVVGAESRQDADAWPTARGPS